jgi:glucose-6-phosphate isomerase
VTSPAHDATIVRLVGEAVGDDTTETDEDTDDGAASVQVAGSLGAQLMLWEVATAVAGRLLGINPFDQPDVESAKTAARSLLDSPPEGAGTDFTDGPVSVQAIGGSWLGDAGTLSTAVDRLLEQVDGEHGYLAVMVYLDRLGHASLEQARADLAARVGRPVTFGWGPRFLHSTGQFHKGGPRNGVYLQVTGSPAEDLPIPGREFGFSTLIAAQAAGDATVLADHGRPVLRVHLDDLDDGLQVLREALS